ncbi:metallophosphoesterase family protein [Capnocytophaga canis]|uniref:metallophosphoesterase family protein n=1 Tax=Capnocytophaga canis TaxID=1848903 RepID=UPI001562A3A5|nr:metallophosphoesterase family protein [Capnocytophaga canis]
MKILLLSDTHSYMDDKILSHASQVDEVWHCGDFGSMEVAKALAQQKPLRGVYGNIDGADVRSQFPEVNRFFCEGIEVLMIHIGGYPDKYTSLARKEIMKNPPKIFISGHSHILKVMYDKKFQLLHLNPGAVGKHGWQIVRTMIRFEIEKEEIKNVQVIEFPR